MKKILAAASGAFFAVCATAYAQWQAPNHSVPVGKGTGLGFSSAAPSATSGIPLVSNGASADPSFSALNLGATGAVTGTLPAGNGGTGQSSLTAHAALIGNGTSAVSSATACANGVLHWAGASVDPTCNVFPQVSGVVLGSSALNQILVGTQTASGTPSGAGGGLTEGWSLSRIILADTGVDASGLPAGSQTVNAFYTGYTSTGGAKGIGVGISGTAFVTGSPATADNALNQFIGGSFIGTVTANMGGTNTGAGAVGAIFGFGGGAIAGSGATNLLNVAGAEINAGIATGASAKAFSVLTLATHDAHAVHGSVYETSLNISAIAGAIGLNNGILFSDYNGQHAVGASGKLISTLGSHTVDYGIDFITYTFTTAAWRSNNALIDGSGNAKFASYYIGNDLFAATGGGFLNIYDSSASSRVIQGSTTQTYLFGDTFFKSKDNLTGYGYIDNTGLHLSDKRSLALFNSGDAGYVQFKAPANSDVAAYTIIMPAPAGTTSTDFSATGGASQVVMQTSVGGAFTVARLACADLSDAASGCSAASGITALTGDVTATGPGSAAATLATVNSNVGSFGSATQVGQFTVNAKGLITAASNVTVTPAVGSITGLGTGIATWLATPSSANLAAAVTDETGSGALVFATSPTLTTPNIGAATATSVNKLAITAPATGATLAIADGKTFTVSNSLTLAGTDSTTMTFPGTSQTIAGLGVAQTFTTKQAIAASSTSGNGGLSIDVTQTQPNSSDTSDGAFSLGYTLSASSATNELVPRVFAFTFTNNLTGGGAITAARMVNLVAVANSGTTTTTLENIYMESASAGTVGTHYGLRIVSLIGTTKWGIYDESGANSFFQGYVRADGGFRSGASTGLSSTISVRKGDGSGACDLVVTGGIITSTTC